MQNSGKFFITYNNFYEKSIRIIHPQVPSPHSHHSICIMYMEIFVITIIKTGYSQFHKTKSKVSSLMSYGHILNILLK